MRAASLQLNKKGPENLIYANLKYKLRWDSTFTNGKGRILP